MKPVIIGPCPPVGAGQKNHQPLFPIPKGCVGHKLQQMTGLSRKEYLRAFNLMDLMPHPEHARKWSASVARWHAANLLHSGLLDGRTVVLLGKPVWLAFGGRPDVEPLEWYEGSVFEHEGSAPYFKPKLVAMLPHPSGLNRWYGQSDNLEWARAFCAELATLERAQELYASLGQAL